MAKEAVNPVFDLIASRRSVRTFDDKPVEDDKLELCLEAARRAPSWANRQCWHFVVVKGKDAVAELGIVPASIKNPPAVVVACGDPGKSGDWEGKQYYLVDVAIATEHLVLEAWEQDLGTVWVGAFKEDKVRKALGIPENIRVVAIIPIGYPADKEGVRQKLARAAIRSSDRKKLTDFVHYGRW
jgi:nitroreductase